MKRCMKYFRPCILGILLLFIIICRFVPAVAEWYALYIYPIIASILSGLSAVFPFSLEEILVLGLAHIDADNRQNPQALQMEKSHNP